MSPSAELLIQESHLRNLHSGPQMDLFALHQNVWIPEGLASLKKIIHNCKPWIRFDAHILQPLMGDLPVERIVESIALQFTGLDYCGPFYTKDSSQKLRSKIRQQISILNVLTYLTTIQCPWDLILNYHNQMKLSQ